MLMVVRKLDATVVALAIAFVSLAAYCVYSRPITPPAAAGQADVMRRALLAEEKARRLNAELVNERAIRLKLQGDLEAARGRVEELQRRLAARDRKRHARVEAERTKSVPVAADAREGAGETRTRVLSSVDPLLAVVRLTALTSAARAEGSGSKQAAARSSSPYAPTPRQETSAADDRVAPKAVTRVEPRAQARAVRRSVPLPPRPPREVAPSRKVAAVPERPVRTAASPPRRTRASHRKRYVRSARYQPTYRLGRRRAATRPWRRRRSTEGFSRSFYRQLNRTGFFGFPSSNR